MPSLTTLDLVPLAPVSEVHAQISALVHLCHSRQPVSVGRWPFPPGPVGPLRLPDGTPPHGAFAFGLEFDSAADELVLLVANNGWPIQAIMLPGPNPGPLACLDPCTCWVVQQPTLVGPAPSTRVISPAASALERVAAGVKALALADFDDEEIVRHAQQTAKALGLATSVERADLPEPDGTPTPIWFLGVARREPFAELVDLGAVAQYYDLALRDDPRRARVAESMAKLGDRRPCDFLDLTDALVMAPFADDFEGDCPTEVTGVVLGYWPPTTAEFLMSLSPAGSTFEPTKALIDLSWWNMIRLEMCETPDPLG